MEALIKQLEGLLPRGWGWRICSLNNSEYMAMVIRPFVWTPYLTAQSGTPRSAIRALIGKVQERGINGGKYDNNVIEFPIGAR